MCSDYFGQMMTKVHSGWNTAEFRALLRDVDRRALRESVLPPELTLRALWYFPPEETKVVILGSDCYHKPGKANGLAFGLSPEWAWDRPIDEILYSSFGNVCAEVKRSTGQAVVDHTLESWAKQGVLLLNTKLSCAPGRPGSHAGIGWEAVTRNILHRVAAESNAVVFAWGTPARTLARRIFPDDRRHEASHPCKYSATRGRHPFLGCDHFARVPEIRWGV